MAEFRRLPGSRCGILLHADDEVGQWVASRIRGAEEWVRGAGRSIGFTFGRRLIAGCSFFRYNGAHVEVAFASDDPRWMSRGNLQLLFEYPFRQLRLQRVTAIVDETNAASRKLIEALGFEREATLARAAIDGDQLVYRMFAEKCRWLEGNTSDEQGEGSRSA